MAAHHHDIDKTLKATLLEILEAIVVGIMNGCYEDENDENLVRVVTSLLAAIGSDTTSSGDALPPAAESEPVETTPTPGCAPIGDAIQKDDETTDQLEESVPLVSDQLLSGDALSPVSEPVDSIAVPGDTPLDNAVREDVDADDTAHDEVSIFMASDELPSGDAPSSEFGPVDPTPIPEDGPLDDAVVPKESDNGEVVGRLDPPATTGKSDQLRRSNTSCQAVVRRIFRRLCFWRRETVRDPR